MSLVAWTYLAYLAVSVGVTVGVGNTLHRHGRSFVLEMFHDDARIADPVNHFLLVGFYLLNIAFALFFLRTRVEPANALAACELLATKIGFTLISLGAMHFVNVAALTTAGRFHRRRAR